VQIVDTLKVIDDLGVVVSKHLCKFLTCLFHLTTFKEDLHLPRPLFDPHIKGALAFCLQVTLRFSKIFLRQQQFEVEFGKVLRNWRTYFIEFLIGSHRFLGKSYCKLQ
jgi:hypothetical protein